jgi:hypothetical protein
VTATPSGWLTYEQVDRIEMATGIADDNNEGHVVLRIPKVQALLTMARWSLSHQAALETAKAEALRRGIEKAIEVAAEHLGHEGEYCPPHIVDEIRDLLTPEAPHD